MAEIIHMSISAMLSLVLYIYRQIIPACDIAYSLTTIVPP